MSKKRILKLNQTRQEFDLIVRGDLKELFRLKSNRVGIRPGTKFDIAQIHVGDKRGRKLIANIDAIEPGERDGKEGYIIKLGEVLEADQAVSRTPYYQAPLKIKCANSHNRKFLHYRKSNDQWPLFHNAVYEAYTGEKIGKYQRIIFKDGNVANCHPDNLEKYHVSELRVRGFEHDEFELTNENMVNIIADHAEEIEKVRKFFGE